MADTVNKTIRHVDGWTLVASTGKGLITTGSSIEYCESSVQPSESLFGHHLPTGESLRYDASGSSLYVRGETILVQTED